MVNAYHQARKRCGLAGVDEGQRSLPCLEDRDQGCKNTQNERYVSETEYRFTLFRFRLRELRVIFEESQELGRNSRQQTRLRGGT